MQGKYILTLKCKDRLGIVADVADFLRDCGGFILESAQFGDASTGMFFMRVVFTNEQGKGVDVFTKGFTSLAEEAAMEWRMVDGAAKMRMALLVTKESHCLNMLLHQAESGLLPVTITSVLSNHRHLQEMVGRHRIPYHYVPIENGDKAAQEAQITAILNKEQVDLVVLARYMQVLSPSMVAQFRGRAINIHHSFLPGFKGARAYHQAYDRGVKLIGATAHYVSDDLDEGPIIEQEVTRVDHADTPESLTAHGRDIEALVLSRAVKAHVEHRVVVNGSKTVVF